MILVDALPVLEVDFRRRYFLCIPLECGRCTVVCGTPATCAVCMTSSTIECDRRRTYSRHFQQLNPFPQSISDGSYRRNNALRTAVDMNSDRNLDYPLSKYFNVIGPMLPVCLSCSSKEKRPKDSPGNNRRV